MRTRWLWHRRSLAGSRVRVLKTFGAALGSAEVFSGMDSWSPRSPKEGDLGHPRLVPEADLAQFAT